MIVCPQGKQLPGGRLNLFRLMAPPPTLSAGTSPGTDSVTAAMAAEGGLPASSISAPSTEEPQRPVLPGSITGGQGATMALGAAEAQRGVSPAVQATFSAGISGEQSHLFAPSPLPGGSPQDGIGAMTSRTQTWMSRLGDLFQQRRVEVHTAWTQSPTSNRRMDNPWVDQQPFTAPPERDLQREQNQTPPSTDSAPIPYELVQAEVSKQLEGAMSEVYKTMTHRLEVEKQRAEEAEQRAQQLRLQLEYMEQQAQGITQDAMPLEYNGMGPNDNGVSGGITAMNVQLPLRPPGLLPQGVHPPEPPATEARPPMLKFREYFGWQLGQKPPHLPLPILQVKLELYLDARDRKVLNCGMHRLP